MNSSNNQKIATLLQFAYKANKLTFGESNIVAMLQKKIHVLVLSNDISETSKKKYLDKANFYYVDVITFISKSDMGELFDKAEVACVGVKDQNMAKQIKLLSQV